MRSRSVERLAPDAASLAVRLLEHDGRLAARLLPELLRGALRRDERGAKQRLELAIANEVAVEPLDLVREVGALAPHLLEALDDVLEQLVDDLAVVPEQRTTAA